MTGIINMSALGKHMSDQTLEIENLNEEIVRLTQLLADALQAAKWEADLCEQALETNAKLLKVFDVVKAAVEDYSWVPLPHELKLINEALE